MAATGVNQADEITPKGGTAAPTSRPADPEATFRLAFRRYARRVRTHLAARRVVAGVVIGLVLGAAGAAGAWQLRQGPLRPWMAALGLAGAAIGAALARRRRWSDDNVALYLDHQLESSEAIATAVEFDREGPPSDGAARAAVIEHAAEALSTSPRKGIWPKIWRLWHLAGPAAAAAIVWLSVVAVPALPPPPPPPPGSEIVQLDDVAGLDEVITLSDLDPRDEAQRKRLDELSKRAKELRRKLREGMPRREAQHEIAKLRDAVAAERMKLGTGEQRAGLEAALGKLAKDPAMDDARKALGDRDLTRFDEEMAKLANKLEEKDREHAKKLLEEAAEAAREQGAEDVAKELEQQKKLMDQRGQQADKLKELARALGEGLSDEAKKSLKSFEQSGDPADQQKLAEALEKALGELSEEERKQLAENLKKRASEIDPDTADAFPLTKEQLEQMQKQLETPEGQKQLAEQLKEMAKEPPKSDGSKREEKLGECDKGLGEGQRQLGLLPMPQDGSSCPRGGGDKPGQKPGQQPGSSGSSGGKDSKDGKPGPGRGGGEGEHDGKTDPVETDPMRARASSPVNAADPMPGSVMGRTPGRAGETANKAGTGQLGVVGPSEVGAVERSEVPEEYREQVGRYFQPH